MNSQMSNQIVESARKSFHGQYLHKYGKRYLTKQVSKVLWQYDLAIAGTRLVAANLLVRRRRWAAAAE